MILERFGLLGAWIEFRMQALSEIPWHQTTRTVKSRLRANLMISSSEQIGSESTVYDKIYTCTESHAAIRALHKP